ncbi:WhiB family transcriptional regulator [Streptomyces sp. NPDC016566]|uniref:WhiB family transcriptional regulator n=1 Tax=Streptomyces sp. NPDC016566 TaxID=3364967 RepID=UPI003700FB77
MQSAAPPCSSIDPELFFPSGHSRSDQLCTDAAKIVCSTCRLQDRCLEMAMQEPQPLGIWGGLTATERRGLSRRSRDLWCGSERLVERLAAGEQLYVRPPHRLAVVLRLQQLGWDSQRIGAAIGTTLRAVYQVRGQTARALAYLRVLGFDFPDAPNGPKGL